MFNCIRCLSSYSFSLIFFFKQKKKKKKKKKKKNSVWPIHSWNRVTCSFLKPGFHSAMLGFIWKSLLCILLLQFYYHFYEENIDFGLQVSIWAFESVKGQFKCWFVSWISFVISSYSSIAWDPIENELLWQGKREKDSS